MSAGKKHVRYAARKSICRVCPLRSRCLTDKARRREVVSLGAQDVVDRHRSRMAQAEASTMMQRRAALAEHPFGTLKCRAGYRHFLVRGFAKVRGEWSLMALCYNFTRVLNIVGFDGFAAALAKAFRSLLRALTAPESCVQPLLQAFWTNIPLALPIKRFGLSLVA